MSNSYSILPSGDIPPRRFCAPTAVSFTVQLATAGTDRVVGISGEGADRPPGIYGDDGLAGRSGGPPMRLFEPGEPCWLEIGGSGCNAWDLLKPADGGRGIPLTMAESGNIFPGARAYEAAASGDAIRVMPLFFGLRPA